MDGLRGRRRSGEVGGDGPGAVDRLGTRCVHLQVVGDAPVHQFRLRRGHAGGPHADLGLKGVIQREITHISPRSANVGRFRRGRYFRRMRPALVGVKPQASK